MSSSHPAVPVWSPLRYTITAAAGWRRLAAGRRTIHQPPVEEGVVHEGLEHRHHTVLVTPQHAHHALARHPVVAVDAGHLTHTSRDTSHDPRHDHRHHVQPGFGHSIMRTAYWKILTLFFENDNAILENDNSILENDNAILENYNAILENDSYFQIF